MAPLLRKIFCNGVTGLKADVTCTGATYFIALSTSDFLSLLAVYLVRFGEILATFFTDYVVCLLDFGLLFDRDLDLDLDLDFVFEMGSKFCKCKFR